MSDVLPVTLTEPAVAIAERLVARGETVAVAESSAGGLISAALLSVGGASAYCRGGIVIYTRCWAARRTWTRGPRVPASRSRGTSRRWAGCCAP